MSDPNTPRDTGVPGLAFIVGGLVVAVVIAYFLFSGGFFRANNAAPSETNVNVTTPAPAPAPESAAPPAGEPPGPAPTEEPTQPPTEPPPAPPPQ